MNNNNQATTTKAIKRTQNFLYALVRECERCEEEKKTEQKILNILKYVNKKEVNKFKRDYLKFAMRYQPKTKREERLKMGCKIAANFESMKTVLNELTNIKIIRKKNIYILKEPFTNEKLSKNINYLLNLYENNIDIMRDYIGRYKCVNRGRWGNEDIILRNLRWMLNFIDSNSYNRIISSSKKVLNKINEFKKCFLDLIDYYEDHRRKMYEERLKPKANELGKRFKKLILKGLFLGLVSPIYDVNSNGDKPDKDTLNYMYKQVENIYLTKYENIRLIVIKLCFGNCQLTDYEIIYSLYLKNI